ncbi:hypothetical protein [Pedobacter sp. BMA]|uniref:hypothetical protein n=1 Tax=Pedobacter sp. BMA TaxID=1663685 RepID=UPI00064A3BC2|nr:hypothetical protein [Pedobacter sp. BMA]KLT63844.1 hypothetical protein AB669_19080 [Pedobacter sp. BMA]
MRTGTVTHIDPILKKGYIEDENMQDICFKIDEATGHINAADCVCFEITLEQDGLVATQIKLTSETISTQRYSRFFCPDNHNVQEKQAFDYF